MTKQKVKKILELKQTKTSREIAQILGYSLDKVNYWLRRARISGHKYPQVRHGRKPLEL